MKKKKFSRYVLETTFTFKIYRTVWQNGKCFNILSKILCFSKKEHTSFLIFLQTHRWWLISEIKLGNFFRRIFQKKTTILPVGIVRINLSHFFFQWNIIFSDKAYLNPHYVEICFRRIVMLCSPTYIYFQFH